MIDGNKKEKAVFNPSTLLDNINSVIKKAIVSNSLIIFIRDKDVADGSGEGFEIHRDIHIPTKAIILDKEATNSFYGTPLLKVLQDNQIEHVVVMGCKTEHCIDTAVRIILIKT